MKIVSSFKEHARKKIGYDVKDTYMLLEAVGFSL